MRIGVGISSTGPQSRPSVLLECARAIEGAGFADLWLQERIAIAPEDSQSGGGRCHDPLIDLAWLAGQTTRIGLGMSALILPYRPPLLTAKAVATIQELSGGRLRLGVGVGWMPSEFQALGVPRSERGRRTDESLRFLRDCFEDDVMEANGQKFMFLPRPERPPIYVGGGAGDHALRRTVQFADGWMPMFQFWKKRPDTVEPEELAPAAARLREMAEEAGRPPPEIIVGLAFDPDAPEAVPECMALLREAGVTGLVVGTAWQEADEFRRHLEFLRKHVLEAA